MKQRNVFVTVATLVMIGLVASSQHHAYASDGQTPNWQILSSNKNQDNTSWERFSVTTLSTYSVSTSSYTMQMNAIVNACTPTDGCAWWLQSVVGIDSGSLVGKSGGYWVHDAHFEEWNRGSDDSFCSVYPSPLINIEQSAYETYIQSTIEIGCGYFCSYSVNLDVYVFNAQLQVVAQAHASCSDPNGPISFFSQIEGVIVDCCVGHSTFTPLNTHLFSAYIDFTSNYNLFSNQYLGTQTGESSNLYQIDHGNTQENYNGMYLFSSSEIDATESST